MWAGKWMILALAGYIEDAVFAVNSIARRSDSEGISRIGTIWRNLGVLWRKPLKLLTVAGIAALLRIIFAQLKKENAFEAVPIALVLALLGVAILPFVWNYLLANTNHTHYFFMHRNLSATIFAALCLITRLLRRRDGRSLLACEAGKLK